uniref:glutathione transferase n=1 Tax=Leersia perrieri TaxID=77586 RepID=A0A0D9XLS9_9ORYZ
MDGITMAGRDNHDLKLLGTWPSPFVIRVRLALSLKGLSYEYIEQDISNKSDLLLVSNPIHKKVPVLIHAGKPICESQIIVHYIDEAFPVAGAALLPSDPFDRAAARFWVAYIDDILATKFRAMGEAKEEKEKGEAAAEVFAAIEKLEEGMKACSKGKAFFGGDGAGCVDVALGGFLGWIKAAEVLAGVTFLDGARTPLLAAWADRFSALDAAKEAIPTVEKFCEFHLARQAAAAAGFPPEHSPNAFSSCAIAASLLGAVSGVSPYVIRAQMALAVKGLAHDYFPEDLTQKSQLPLDSNPVHKSVPVLIHNGKPVCDSLVIVEYIHDAFPGAGIPLLPSDPYDRAVARFWAAFIDAKVFPPCLVILEEGVKTDQEGKAAKVEETLAALQLMEGAFGHCSKGNKPFFGGDAVGYLDVGVTDIAGVTPPLLDAARTPELVASAARFRADKTVGSLVPGVDKVEKYVNTVLYPKWKAAGAAINPSAPKQL